MEVPETQPNTSFTQERRTDAVEANGFPVEQAAADGDYEDELECAACKGDWKTADRIISEVSNVWDEEKLKTGLSSALLAAVFRGHSEFIVEMLKPVRDPQLLTGVIDNGNILHYVAGDGNLKEAKALVDKCPSLIMTYSSGLTPLHIAVLRANDKDLVWYLTLVTREDEASGHLFSGPSAAFLIAFLMAAGYHDIIHFLLQKNHSLAEAITTGKHPYENKPVLCQLASEPSEFRSGTKLGWLECCIYPFIPVEVDQVEPPRHVQQLVPGPSTHPRMQISMQSITAAFQRLKFRRLVWSLLEKLVPGVQVIRDTKLKHEWNIELIKTAFEHPNWNTRDWSSRFPNFTLILKEAASSGITEILQIFLEKYVYLLGFGVRQSLVIASIKHRQEKVFNLLLRNCAGFSSVISTTPRERPVKIENVASYKEGTNILHMTAKLTDCPKITSIAGAAFKLQRELQWFKGMEIWVHPLDKEARNTNSDTAWEFFKKEHQDMRKEGEEWMKDTSNSCVLVATLIATVVFAAAFTVPGGNNQDNGTPIFLQRNKFMLFAAFDALAFFLSINSLWMFLSILTARFAFDDFLKTLPKRLILGFATLFLAIISTIVAFSAALSLVLGHRQGEVIVVVVLMAFVSVATFAWLQLPLFVYMVRSTYGPKLLLSR